MGTENPGDIDRVKTEAHAQRTAEQTALRKVRKTLNRSEQDEADERSALRYVLSPCVLLAMLALWFSWEHLLCSQVPKPPPRPSQVQVQPRRRA